jgi:cytochrome P450
MALKDKIMDDIKTAMKDKNQARLDTLRFLHSAIKNKEIEVRPFQCKTLVLPEGQKVVGSTLEEDQVVIAGHETTSIALTWAWYLLSQHPEQYDSLVQGENVVGLVREVLRLYPPTWITAREVISPVTFDSFALQPGDLIFVFILAIHHSTKWWGEDVLEFRPDRWSVTYTSTSTPGRWLPFGGGPRVCAGANFALTEMKIFMQTFAQAGGRFTLADPTHVPVPVAGFTRKPKDPLYMKMRFIS